MLARYYLEGIHMMTAAKNNAKTPVDLFDQVLPRTWPIHGLMLVMVLFVASSFPVGKLIAGKLPSDVMMLIRFSMAALLFAPYIFIKHGLHIPTVRSLCRYALLSLPLVTFFWCMFEALKYTTALNTGALFTTVPLMTAVFSTIINKERTRILKSTGLLCGAVGAIWIVFKGDFSALLFLDFNIGDSIFLVGALVFSLYNPLIKRMHDGEPTEVMTFWVILFGAGWLLLLSLPELVYVEWGKVDAMVYGGLLYLAVFTTLLSFFLTQYGIVKLGATKVASYSFLNPLFVLVLTILMGSVSFSLSFAPGILLVIFAMFLIQIE
ncbi:DMT family transporter [Marinomonas balearica]|uniref:Drug/metabolite transporter (DMT)-like permease n=1 Tax=Marinomonas balearica TaxID=491947 RepID=A0A4R6MJN2_9GAMM|nr:DMT family transporter [Marinomonas balearica]TDP01867.1 drug/metabolite transporter (DMT)-like permease [Marinomonas balearica]